MQSPCQFSVVSSCFLLLLVKDIELIPQIKLNPREQGSGVLFCVAFFTQSESQLIYPVFFMDLQNKGAEG